jgi:hypothetical protein
MAMRVQEIHPAITHRTLNVSGLIMSVALAYMRGQQRRPSAACMAGGLALTPLLSCSVYLGGRMTKQMAVDAGSAMGGAAKDAVRGRFVPVLQERSTNRSRPPRAA